MNNRHLTLSLAVALALASPCVSAMGLGQLQVKSGLNQPLVAEIPIISATPSELDQLDVRLASPEAFARIGLGEPGELTANLQFSVGENSRGQPVIRVTTPGRFSEPVLNFLIEAEWGKGTVTREYTALIDPPYIAPAVIQPMLTPAIAAAPAAAPVAPPVAPPVAVAPTPVQPEPEPVQAPPPVAAPEPVAVAPTPIVEAAPPAPAPRPAAPAPTPAPPKPAAPPAQPIAAPAPKPAPAATPGEYGPVRSGQTLWKIADSVRPDAGVSVNQMMVALLRANPEAFAQDNVNLLKRGSVLRIPGQEEVSRLSAADAAALVSQQASAWRSPHKPVPQPAETTPTQNIAPAAAAPRVASSTPRPTSRLEIVPPSGDAKARGAQSGAAAGAGGSELRAELVQSREELAARNSEVTELKSQITDLEKQDADRQRLIEMQNSQMKELQDRLRQVEADKAAAPVATAAAAAAKPAAVEPAWYLNPFILGGGVLVLLGGLVLAMRRKPASDSGDASRRLSDDDALRASLAKTRQAGERIKQEPSLFSGATTGQQPVMPPTDPELEALKAAVRARPQDLEAHLSLLRLHHSRGNAVDYEIAAQSMRVQAPSTMDPRWREAVIMGASLMPGHVLFSQAGWNSPRYSDSEPVGKSAATPAPAAPAPSEPALEKAPEPAPEPLPVFDEPVEFNFADTDGLVPQREDDGLSNELNLDEHSAVFSETFGSLPLDIHRNEAELMAEDEASATRIELAKAYLDIGDLDGARSMLEEVLAEGGPTAKAEAARLLKEMD